MKKTLILSIILSGLLGYNIAKADIIIYKDGQIKGNVTSDSIRLKYGSKVFDIKREDVKGISVENEKIDKMSGGWRNGKRTLEQIKEVHRWQYFNIGCDSNIACDFRQGVELEIKLNGEKEPVTEKDIKRYVLTNNVVPDDKVAQRYELINLVDKFCKGIQMLAEDRDTFCFYDDKLQQTKYLMEAIHRLKISNDSQDIKREQSRDKKSLELLEDKLKKEGYDTCIFQVTSMGDDMTPSDTEKSVPEFVEILMHEYWHESLDRRHPQMILEESTAKAIGLACAEAFLLQTYGETSKEFETIKDMRREAVKKGKAVVEYYEKLSELYNSQMPDEKKLELKEEILNKMKEKTGYMMNNAELSGRINYYKYFELVDNVIRNQENLTDAINILKRIPTGNLDKKVEYLQKFSKKE